MPAKKPSIGASIGAALRCAASPKRVVPFFAVNLVYLLMIVALFDSLSALIVAASTHTLTGGLIVQFVPAFAAAVLVVVVMFFVSLYFKAGLMDNAGNFWRKKEVKFSQSLRSIRPMYLSFVGSAILAGVISGIFSLIPIVGALISLVLSWLFFLTIPSVILGKKDAVGSLQESYHIFMKEKWQTFLMWLSVVVLVVLLALVALIPLAVFGLPAILAIRAVGVIAAIRANMGLLVIGGIISSYLLAYMTVFSESAKAFYYVQVKKVGR